MSCSSKLWRVSEWDKIKTAHSKKTKSQSDIIRYLDITEAVYNLSN